MSYAMANVVYGIDLTGVNLDSTLDTNYTYEDDEELGILSWYSGGGGDNTPRAFGVEFVTIDECETVARKVSTLTPSPEQLDEMKAKYRALYDGLPSDLKHVIDAVGIQSDLIMVWSTS